MKFSWLENDGPRLNKCMFKNSCTASSESGNSDTFISIVPTTYTVCMALIQIHVRFLHKH